MCRIFAIFVATDEWVHIFANLVTTILVTTILVVTAIFATTIFVVTKSGYLFSNAPPPNTSRL